jgi:hypothetical protein
MSKIINHMSHLIFFAIQQTYPRLSFFLSTWGVLLIFSLMNLQSCGLDVEDPKPPPPPAWIQKSLPEEWPERGIDAHESGGIYLQWTPEIDENAMAILIYRAELFFNHDSLGDYELIQRIAIEPQMAREYIDSQVAINSVYHYRIGAEDIFEKISYGSVSTYYSLLPQIRQNSMIPNGLSVSLNAERKLSWEFTYVIEMEDYILTILNQNNDFVCREIFNPVDYINGSESWIIPDSVELVPNQIYKWRIDTGAKYVNSNETYGSESVWASFYYAN